MGKPREEAGLGRSAIGSGWLWGRFRVKVRHIFISGKILEFARDRRAHIHIQLRIDPVYSSLMSILKEQHQKGPQYRICDETHKEHLSNPHEQQAGYVEEDEACEEDIEGGAGVLLHDIHCFVHALRAFRPAESEARTKHRAKGSNCYCEQFAAHCHYCSEQISELQPLSSVLRKVKVESSIGKSCLGLTCYQCTLRGHDRQAHVPEV